jgi:hypothetical protein
MLVYAIAPQRIRRNDERDATWNDDRGPQEEPLPERDREIRLALLGEQPVPRKPTRSRIALRQEHELSLGCRLLQ